MIEWRRGSFAYSWSKGVELHSSYFNAKYIFHTGKKVLNKPFLMIKDEF